MTMFTLIHGVFVVPGASEENLLGYRIEGSLKVVIMVLALIWE